MDKLPQITLLFIFLMLIIITACQPEKEQKKGAIFSTENLPKTTFQFSSNRDTFLIGKRGSSFHIPANAFVNKEGEIYKGQIEVELLEAFTLEDMILGNLTTITDDGRLLESSGMFRLSIKGNGKTLKVKPNAKVMMTIPAISLQEDSKIFYGKIDDQKGLTWKLANSTDIDTTNKRLLLGHLLFLKECASCHNINLTQDMTGPALAWVEKRWETKEDLIAFTRNSEGFAMSGNLRARAMVQWAPSTMTAFMDMSDKEINAIYYYIREKARALEIDSTGQELVSNAYYQAYFDRQDSIRAVLDSIQNAQDSIQNVRYQVAISNGSNLLFQISNTLNKSFNWVNVDRYASIADGPMQKDLKVSLNAKELNYHLKEVKIILPNRNSMILAYPNFKEGYYSFTERYQLKSTPFPVGAKAYLMATAMAGDEIYFALKPITIGDNSLEELDLKLISKENLIEKIKTIF